MKTSVFKAKYACYLGKHKVKDFNVYLHPLVDELVKLWNIETIVRDVSVTNESMRNYRVHMILMWIMHDYPNNGMTSSLQIHGLNTCPTYGLDEVLSYSIEYLKKVIYNGNRKFLNKEHRWKAYGHNKKYKATKAIE
jgi:hypothetical protein